MKLVFIEENFLKTSSKYTHEIKTCMKECFQNQKVYRKTYFLNQKCMEKYFH